MGIEVERLDGPDDVDWNSLVERSPMGSVFHHTAALDVLADHSGGRLHLLAGYKGQEVVGLFPVFELSKGPVSTAFSPPPRLGVPALGPVLTNYGKLKRKKLDRRTKGLVDGALDWLERELDPGYTHIETTPAFRDARPFLWSDYEVTPRYTYELDLTGGTDAVLEGFKRNLRSRIRRHEDADYEVFVGGADAIDFIIDQVRARFEQQGETYAIEAQYVRDLHAALPDDALRPYVGAVDGQYHGGVLVPALGEELFFWQGGGKPDAPLPINDLVHWRIIQDAVDRGLSTYNLTGANTHRIAEYKAKFNPDLSPYYEVERGTRTMNVVSGVYRRLR